jgi:hypothetical protein
MLKCCSNVPTNLEKITSIIIPYFPILTVFGQFDIKTVNRPDGGHDEIFQPNSCIITTAMKPVCSYIKNTQMMYIYFAVTVLFKSNNLTKLNGNLIKPQETMNNIKPHCTN